MNKNEAKSQQAQKRNSHQLLLLTERIFDMRAYEYGFAPLFSVVGVNLEDIL